MIKIYLLLSWKVLVIIIKTTMAGFVIRVVSTHLVERLACLPQAGLDPLSPQAKLSEP
jgi:hypothetical protein